MCHKAVHEVCALLQVCQLANYLKSVGVKRGSDVTIYMPMIPELPAAMVGLLLLATAHLASCPMAVSMLGMHSIYL